jgi:hypothetical protein
MMDTRERPASDLGRTGQPLSDEDLTAVTGGAGTVAGLSGPEIRKGAGRSIGSMESITVGSAQSPGLG